MRSYVFYGHSYNEVNEQFDNFLRENKLHINDIKNIHYDNETTNRGATYSICISIEDK